MEHFWGEIVRGDLNCEERYEIIILNIKVLGYSEILFQIFAENYIRHFDLCEISKS